MLQETLNQIESAQADVNIFNALKTGDQVLKDLQKQCSIEDWEALYEDHQENMAIYDQEVEMFGEVLKEDDLMDELDKMCADQVADQIADLEPLPDIPAQQEAEEEQEEEA